MCQRGMLEQAALAPDLWRCTGIASPGVRRVSGLGGHSGDKTGTWDLKACLQQQVGVV